MRCFHSFAFALALALLSAGGGVRQLTDCDWLEARLVRVVDADTLVLDFELGAEVALRNQRVRLLEVDAPEMRTNAGRACRARVVGFLCKKPLAIELAGKDKYGRWLAHVRADGEDLGEWLLREGCAVRFKPSRSVGGRPRPAASSPE